MLSQLNNCPVCKHAWWAWSGRIAALVRGLPSSLLDARTDLFSFEVVLYEMATGQLPFRSESSAVIFEAIMSRAPVPPLRLNPDLPPKIEAIIERALEKDRGLRYQHASDIRAELVPGLATA